MTFKDVLNHYIDILDINSNILSDASGISPSSISRYRTGEREPAFDSTYIDQIAEGIFDIAQEKNMDISFESVRENLIRSLDVNLDISYAQYIDNIGLLLKVFGIKGNAVAKYMTYDPSHISKILSGQRRPGNISRFTDDVSCYTAGRITTEVDRIKLKSLLEDQYPAAEDEQSIADAISKWLKSYSPKSESDEGNDDPTRFLRNLEEFNIDEYIKAIHFNDIKIPKSPIDIPKSKYYYGIEGFREAELNFLLQSVISRYNGEVTLYSDMPMEKMSEEKEFAKKWMCGMAAMLKKGMILNVIHNIDRPWSEMMLGLEAYIPIYMTGQIRPYYFEKYPTEIFHQLISVSPSCALQGEAIIGHHEEGRYYLTTKKAELEYFKNRANAMLEHAKPLMDIYNVSRKDEFKDLLKSIISSAKTGCRVIHSSLPIFTISEKLLKKMLAGNDNISETDMIEYLQRYRECVENYIADRNFISEIPKLGREDFEGGQICLEMPGAFPKKIISYTYEDYIEHLKLTRKFAKENENYTLEEKKNLYFRNIHILISPKKYVVISKIKSPTIHFVIHHPKMMRAIEKMVIPVIE